MNMKTKTRAEIMRTRKGKQLYQTISHYVDWGFEVSPRVKDAMERGPCVLGSQTWIESLVYKILTEKLK